LAERGMSYPADLYLEGSDQYRGWFNSSLITSVAVNGYAPYKGLLSHGFVLDGDGRKMSKSLGNIIAPAKIMQQYGADILRLWVASVDYTADVRISMDMLKQVSEVYRKVRNTLKFVHGNLADFNAETDYVAYEKLREVDQYMYMELQKLIKTVRTAYDNYEFATVYKAVNNFIATELSSFYLDIAKDVVYVEAPNSHARRAMQSVMYDTLNALVKLLAPIIPHTSDEMWEYMAWTTEDSVQLTDMPDAVEKENFAALTEKWATIMSVRDVVLKSLEEARTAKVIGKSLEATATVYADAATKAVLADEAIDFAQMMIVSEFVLDDLANATDECVKTETVAVAVVKASGEKCARCWTIDTTVGQNDKHADLCERCATVVGENFADVDLEAK